MRPISSYSSNLRIVTITISRIGHWDGALCAKMETARHHPSLVPGRQEVPARSHFLGHQPVSPEWSVRRVSFAHATRGIVEPCCLACDNHSERFSSDSPLIAVRAAEVISKPPQDAHWNSTFRRATSASSAVPAQTGHVDGKYRLSNDKTFMGPGSLLV